MIERQTMKKKMALILIAAVLLITAAVGGSLASYETGGLKALETIELKDTEVALAASPFKSDEVTLDGLIAMPGDTIEFDNEYFVENPSEDNYTVYTRVTIERKWMLHELESDMVELLLTCDEKDWIVDDSIPNKEQIVLYYRHPLEVGQRTDSFLEGLYFKPEMGNEYSKAEMRLTVKVDAVQAAVIEKAMPAEWGVFPVFGEDGITLDEIEE